jgi:hypothetical protein
MNYELIGIDKHLIIMIVNKLSRHLLFQARVLQKFSGDHHHDKPYDWREDHAKNPDLFFDQSMIGVRNPDEYEFPYKEDKKMEWIYSHPPEYDQKNLATNMVGSGLPAVSIINDLSVHIFALRPPGM